LKSDSLILTIFPKAIFVLIQNGENQYFPEKTEYLPHEAANFNNHLAKVIKTVDIWIVILTQGTRVYIQVSWLSLWSWSANICSFAVSNDL